MPGVVLITDFSVSNRVPAGIYHLRDINWGITFSKTSGSYNTSLILDLQDTESGDEYHEALWAASLATKPEDKKPSRAQAVPSKDGKSPVLGLTAEQVLDLYNKKQELTDEELEQAKGPQLWNLSDSRFNYSGGAARLMDTLIDKWANYDKKNVSLAYFRGSTIRLNRIPTKNPQYDDLVVEEVIKYPGASSASTAPAAASSSTANAGDEIDIESALEMAIYNALKSGPLNKAALIGAASERMPAGHTVEQILPYLTMKKGSYADWMLSEDRTFETTDNGKNWKLRE
jgi:hypothetical protein